MTKTRIAITSAVATLLAASALLGGVLVDGSDEPRRALAASPVSAPTPTAADPGQEGLERLLAGLSTGDTAGTVEGLERAVAKNPYDVESLTLLGLAYQQRQRETGDPAYFGLSERALRKAVELQRQEPLALTGLALLAVARHRWNDAVGFARQALERNPDDASALAALGDAYLSLGRYPEAFDAYDRVAVLAPSPGSYARVAHARELLGRPDHAIEALELAFEVSGTAIPENDAWVRVQLGNLQLGLGRLDAAEAAYRVALERYEGYLPAEAGLARVEAARGDLGAAAARLRHVVERLPLPQHAIALGDVLTAAGRDEEAREAYAVVDAIDRLLAAGGVRTELQTALFDLDRGRDLAGALERARAAYKAAPGVNAADVLAWALYRNGRCEEARELSGEALRLGTRDPLMLFHRGMIERCLGRDGEARRFLRQALQINPYFSLRWAPVAEEGIA